MITRIIEPPKCNVTVLSPFLENFEDSAPKPVNCCLDLFIGHFRRSLVRS